MLGNWSGPRRTDPVSRRNQVSFRTRAGYARNTVRERIAQATAAGFGRQGPPLTAAEWRAALANS